MKRSRTFNSIILTIIVTLAAVGAPAQDSAVVTQGEAAPGGRIDPKAAGLFDQCVTLIEKHGVVEFTSKSGVSKVVADTPRLGAPEHFVVDFRGDGKTGPFGRISVHRSIGENVTEQFIHDGKQFRFLDHAEKSYIRSPEGMEVLVTKLGLLRKLDAKGVVIGWLHSLRTPEGPDGSEKKIVSCSILREETLDGIPCVVIQRETLAKSGGAPSSAGLRTIEIVAFAKADGFPRRIDLKLDKKLACVVELSAVKIGGPVDEAVFSIRSEPPEGYEDKSEELESKMTYKVKAGDPAPDFALRDLEGREVTLASLKGKVLLLDFWASWCGPCVRLMPAIQKISDDYKDQDVVVLGVNVFEKKKGAGAVFMKARGHGYGCLLEGDDLATALGIQAIPTLVVIGRDGKIEMIGSGSTPVRPALEKALEMKATVD